MVIFDDLMKKWIWSPIGNCPGRFVLRESGQNITPAELGGESTQFAKFEIEKAPDIVVVGRIGGGGVISYRRANGSFLHALNNTEGFERKLTQLGTSLRKFEHPGEPPTRSLT